MVRLSLIIPIYLLDASLVQITRDCLFSLKGQYDELVVVDDASPLSSSWVKEEADTLIHHRTNQGFTRSVNDGLAVASGQYVCVANNDTQLLSGSLTDLCGNGYCFPRIEGKSKPFWDGAFFVVDRRLWQGDDPRFTNYFGDLDRFLKAKREGIPLQRVDTVVVRHLEEQTSRKAGIRNTNFDVGKQLFEAKWGIPYDKAYAELEN